MTDSRIPLDHLSARALHAVLSETASSDAPAPALVSIASRGDSGLEALLLRHWTPERVAALRRDLEGETRVVQLGGWKQQLKETWSDCRHDAERRAVMVLLHAVVAKAYARHGEWITSRRQAALITTNTTVCARQVKRRLLILEPLRGSHRVRHTVVGPRRFPRGSPRLRDISSRCSS